MVTTRGNDFLQKAIGSKPPTSAFEGSYWTPRCGGIDRARGSPERCRPAARTRDTARFRPCSGFPDTGRRRGVSAYSSERQMPVNRPLDPVASCQAGAPLPAERPAESRAEPDRQIDRRLLALDLTSPLGGVRVREVRREAQHRAHLTSARVSAAHRGSHVRLSEAAEETVVVLEPVGAERRGGRGSRPRSLISPRHSASK